MLSSLWKYIALALSVVASLLGAALLYTSGQKEKAKEVARSAKAKAKSQVIIREVEHTITEAREAERARAVEVEREQMEARQSGKRPRVFGDSRLHNDRDDNDPA